MLYILMCWKHENNFKLMTSNLLSHDNFCSCSASPFLREKLKHLMMVSPVTGDCCSGINKICMSLVLESEHTKTSF